MCKSLPQKNKEKKLLFKNKQKNKFRFIPFMPKKHVFNFGKQVFNAWYVENLGYNFKYKKKIGY